MNQKFAAPEASEANPGGLDEGAEEQASIEIAPEPIDRVRHRRVTAFRGGIRTNSGPRKLAQLRQDTVGQRLTERRLKLKLTQAEVAAQIVFRPKAGPRKGQSCQLSRNAYCMYELNETEPSLPVIEGLSRVLRVSSAWIAFGKRRSRKDAA